MRLSNKFYIAFLLCTHALSAIAAIDAALLKPLTGDDPDARIAAVAKIAALASPEAQQVLNALKNDSAYSTPDGEFLIVADGKAFHPLNGQISETPDGIDGVTVNNRLRAVVDGALSGFKLLSPERTVRLSAALELQKSAAIEQIPLIEIAIAKEQDDEILAILKMVMASANLQSPDAAIRRQAAHALAQTRNASLKPVLQAMLEKSADGLYAEPDEAVRREVAATLKALDSHLALTEFVGNLVYGISLGSVLLLAALGLAITFGLMGIINMAHGELLMIGAYTTYVVQMLFRSYLPAALDAYLIVALPAAFIVAAAVGIALERTVIRWLYGRPLETLLATWGISLMLMQTVRSIFGAQNVEVANPSWMSGGVTVLGSLVLSYNRIVIVFFSLLVVLAVWLILNKTRLGLFVRAVMQNRRMADCVGVSTAKVDMMTFGLGSGIAGLGGVALSQLGNVGPDLGQSYIVDSFMVVVLGGVGQLAGTVIAAFGLGEVNKFLEPFAGAVMGKIFILIFIIIFIQRRPQGLFALKGRSVE
ncbi:urea ABC transporter permease subunit UrtB [Undibacterium parvum]|uniref:Urea ABC transporter permease subunit UrtB n=1 Tax=Undibacterium parvum TaxID=401471 RepID=A0A3Q9BS92_9BURK|nr:urea ABC transporter permease subunit UrtB [Undibacterium parvum]AZP13208.1 urea ABC transporter permease subunit UrtB [Undibacterium parvum]